MSSSKTPTYLLLQQLLQVLDYFRVALTQLLHQETEEKVHKYYLYVWNEAEPRYVVGSECAQSVVIAARNVHEARLLVVKGIGTKPQRVVHLTGPYSYPQWGSTEFLKQEPVVHEITQPILVTYLPA
jgi:hypothetical protein